MMNLMNLKTTEYCHTSTEWYSECFYFSCYFTGNSLAKNKLLL